MHLHQTIRLQLGTLRFGGNVAIKCNQVNSVLSLVGEVVLASVANHRVTHAGHALAVLGGIVRSQPSNMGSSLGGSSIDAGIAITASSHNPHTRSHNVDRLAPVGVGPDLVALVHSTNSAATRKTSRRHKSSILTVVASADGDKVALVNELLGRVIKRLGRIKVDAQVDNNALGTAAVRHVLDDIFDASNGSR